MGQTHGAGKCEHVLGSTRHLPSSLLKGLLCIETIRKGLNETYMSPARNLENSLITFSSLVFQLEVEDSEAHEQELVSHKLEGTWVP